MSRRGRGGVRRQVPYNVVDPAVKYSEFNRPFALLAYALIVKRIGRDYQLYLMESVNAETTRAVLEAGIVNNPIMAFTNSKDFYKIPARELNIGKIMISAGELYEILNPHGHYIICHDGHALGKNTLVDIKKLIDTRPRSLGLCVNISANCGEYSHETFAGDVRDYAEKHGYTVFAGEKIKSYRQYPRYGRPMWVYWFEMDRISK